MTDNGWLSVGTPLCRVSEAIQEPRGENLGPSYSGSKHPAPTTLGKL